jgi:hypothetical protein
MTGSGLPRGGGRAGRLEAQGRRARTIAARLVSTAFPRGVLRRHGAFNGLFQPRLSGSRLGVAGADEEGAPG